MSLQLAFMGTPEFAVPTLAALIAAGHEIVCVYSQPPRPKGRGLSEIPSPVHAFAVANGIEVRTPVSLKDGAQQRLFADLNIDAAIVVAYGLLLPKPILEAPRLGCFNLHGSLLPRWRGAAPIQRSIMAGDAETGIMVMCMEEGLDTGPVLMTEKTLIGRKTYGELHDELSQVGAPLMVRALAALEAGTAVETPQGDGATYARKILKDEARIDWTKSAREVDSQIRGLSPIPGAFSEIRGERVKILFAEPVSGKGAPGEILDASLTVACGDGALRLTRLQRAGKGAMSAEELLRGFALAKGERFS